MPPDVIFYSETGGKTSPFYRTLGGIKSALKTTWWARDRQRALKQGRNPLQPEPKAYRGTVTWEEIDLKTGLPLLPSYSELNLNEHLAFDHPNLILGHDPIETHDLAHRQVLDHVHRES